ncbi:MAG: ShlB/FhaC/HecB family hemolysin secretion/activation protein [Candidatus Omnitrophota bacterium]
MIKHCLNRIYKAGLLSFFALTAVSAYSEVNVEKATRQIDILNEPQKIEEKLRTVPEKPLEPKIEKAPIITEKEEKKFLTKKIILAGVESFPPEEFDRIVKKYENKEWILEGLNLLTDDIEREYLKKNIIAAAFVPPQDIKEGTVTIQIVEAKMGKLDIQDHKYFKKERLSYYWDIPPGEVMRFDKISRSIQMMNKNPDRKVKSALRAGEKQGTTDVALTAETHFPIHPSCSVDNEGTTASGKYKDGLGIRHNNFLGLDDMLIAGYFFGREFDGIYGYHNLPISPKGTSLVYGYVFSKANPKKDYETLGVHAKSQNFDISFHQDFYKKDKYIGEGFFGFTAKEKTITLNTGTYSRDRLRIISLGGNFIRQNLAGTTIFSPEFHQGIDCLGASSKGNPLASRGAKSVFSKLNIKIQYRKILPLSLRGNILFESQSASTKLTPQEEFSLGGLDSVRGYPSGDYLADNAAIFNGELLIPSFFIPQGLRFPCSKDSLKERVTLLTFLDYGWGKRKGASPTENPTANMASIGSGVRLKLSEQSILRLEWGFPFGDDSITEEGHSRFHFSLDFQI